MLLGAHAEDDNGHSYPPPKPLGGSNKSYNKYKSADSMVYHQSMFLKRLSNPYMNHDPKHHITWREILGEFMESKKVQIFMFSLIILDLLVIVAQLFIIEPQHCHADAEDEILASHSSSSHHTPTENPTYHLAGEVLDSVSLGILCTLALESVLLFVAFDFKLFKQPLYVLDALVIGASLSVEVVESNNNISDIASLLVFFRLWRMVRIVHGVAMSVQEKNEKAIHELELEVQELTKQKSDLQTKYDYLKKRYKKLVAEVESNMQPNKSLSESENEPQSTSPSYNPPPSYNRPFVSPGAPHHQVQPRIRSKPLRIDDTDLSDNDASVRLAASVSVSVDGLPAADRAVTINDDEEVRRPLVNVVSKSPVAGVDYSTFKH